MVSELAKRGRRGPESVREEDKKEDDDYDHNKFFEEMMQKMQSEVEEPDK